MKGRYRERMPIFELMDNGVNVEIINSGVKYVSSEEHFITYEEFNHYLAGGIENRKKGGNHLEELYQRLTKYIKNRKIYLPNGMVRWTLTGTELEMTEKVGGPGFHTLEVYTKEEGQVGKKRVADYGGIYEITVRINLITDELRLLGVNKFTGILYYENRMEKELETVPYLEKYLKDEIKQNQMTVENYLETGLEVYLTEMRNYEHSVPFLAEVERVEGIGEPIDWRVVHA